MQNSEGYMQKEGIRSQKLLLREGEEISFSEWGGGVVFDIGPCFITISSISNFY
jgi:hypothetical protein